MHTRLSLSLAISLLAALIATHALSQTTTDTKKKPDKPNRDLAKQMGKHMKSGDVDEKGVYQMAGDELTMDCKKLTGSMLITIARLKDDRNRPDPSALAQSGAKNVPYLFGGKTPPGADRQVLFARERAKLDAYNKQLTSKNCKTVDIEAELARAPEGPKKY